MDKTLRYEAFLNMPGALSFEEANRIYNMIMESAPEQDEVFDRKYQTFVERAEKYTTYRAGWLGMSRQQKFEIDEERSRNHDLFIKAKNELSAYMYEQKLGNDWDDLLGEERKRIGDFACFLVYVRSVLAR